MFPILPILILLLLGPANAERLAHEGRLPAVLLAVHRTMAPVAVATVEEEKGPAALPRGKRPFVSRTTPILSLPSTHDGFAPGWPTRAGPMVA